MVLMSATFSSMVGLQLLGACKRNLLEVFQRHRTDLLVRVLHRQKVVIAARADRPSSWERSCRSR